MMNSQELKTKKLFCVMEDSDVEFLEPIKVTEPTTDDLEFEKQMILKYNLSLATE